MNSTREAREKAVKQALANSALAGMKPDQDFRALLDRYIGGEITLEEAIEHVKAQYGQESAGPAS